jgi:hypothetical protein
MRAIKPLMFAALAGLPLTIMPAMAQNETPAKGTTPQGTTYSQSAPSGQAVTSMPQQPDRSNPENAGGGGGAGGGESGGSGK